MDCETEELRKGFVNITKRLTNGDWLQEFKKRRKRKEEVIIYNSSLDKSYETRVYLEDGYLVFRGTVIEDTEEDGIVETANYTLKYKFEKENWLLNIFFGLVFNFPRTICVFEDRVFIAEDPYHHTYGIGDWYGVEAETPHSRFVRAGVLAGIELLNQKFSKPKGGEKMTKDDRKEYTLMDVLEIENARGFELAQLAKGRCPETWIDRIIKHADGTVSIILDGKNHKTHEQFIIDFKKHQVHFSIHFWDTDQSFYEENVDPIVEKQVIEAYRVFKHIEKPEEVSERDERV
jgi:hypothetical protein